MNLVFEQELSWIVKVLTKIWKLIFSKMRLFHSPGPFKRGTLWHAHTPTHAQKGSEVWKITRTNQIFDCTILLLNFLRLIKVCAYYHVTIIQTAVIDY